jgi:lactoylglutathione lyase
MELGAFSVSLTVKDIVASRDFYQKLGFEVTGGVLEQNWLVLVNGTTVIGLFQGMFERNMLTFNPGWSQAKEELTDFTDVRALQAELEARGLSLTTRTDGDATGIGHITLVDPDGNPILIDQHVACADGDAE